MFPVRWYSLWRAAAQAAASVAVAPADVSGVGQVGLHGLGDKLRCYRQQRADHFRQACKSL